MLSDLCTEGWFYYLLMIVYNAASNLDAVTKGPILSVYRFSFSVIKLTDFFYFWTFSNGQY